jgi:hypothetical protein
MSAVTNEIPVASAKPAMIDLYLKATGALKRELVICLHPGDYVYAAIHLPKRKNEYSSGKLASFVGQLETSPYRPYPDTFKLRYETTGIELVIKAGFIDVTAEEAQRIEEAFAPHGLRVEREEKGS